MRDTINMARDAKMPFYWRSGEITYLEQLKTFEALVRADERSQRQWVGLTDEERGQVYADWRFNGGNSSNLELCRAIEAKLREKNGGQA